MEVKGIAFIITLLFIFLIPLKRFLGEEGSFSFKFTATITAFVFITADSLRNHFIDVFHRINLIEISIEFIVILVLIAFIDKENRSEFLQGILFVFFSEIGINEKGFLGILLNPQGSDLAIIFFLAAISYGGLEYRVLDKLDKNLK